MEKDDDKEMGDDQGDITSLSDEQLRKLLKPKVTKEQVAQVLQEHYASDGQAVQIIKELDSYDDQNFLVQIAHVDYLLKVQNGVESMDYRSVVQDAQREYYQPGQMKSMLHLQNAMIDALTRHQIPTTVSIQPRSSQLLAKSPPLVVVELPVVSDQHSPCLLVCRLLTWIPGRPMSTVPLLPPEVLADAGRFLARMHHALDDLEPDRTAGLVALRRVESQGLEATLAGFLQHPPADAATNGSNNKNDDGGAVWADESILIPARRYHQWDGRNTADVRTYVQYIKDERRRGLVNSVLDAFQKEILDSGVGENFRMGINHADFNDANIIVNDQLQVAGVIDFGDAVESWRILDVTIAMAYAMLSTYGKVNRSISAAAAVLRGYNSVNPLTATERKHLMLLMACRLSCSVTLGAYSYQLNPANQYLLLHSQPAWTALELIWSYDEERRAAITRAANRVFDQACLYTDPNETIMTCYDLVIPDPGVADLLQDVRVSSFDVGEPLPKKQKCNTKGGYPVITVVTGNSGKLEEVKRILGIDLPETGAGASLPYHLTNMKIDLPELQGDAMEITRAKCAAAVEKVGGAVIVEDTSLCFNVLNGMPGVYIKWFLEACGHEGLNKMLSGFEDKTAYAQTVVAFCPGPGSECAIFDGRTTGKIVMPRGKLDFGWDPIFEPDEGNGKTYAEMSKDEKDAISHRSRAFSRLREYLNKFRKDILAHM